MNFHIAQATLTLPDVVMLGTIIGAIIGVINFFVALGNQLWARKRGNLPEQSDGCKVDHNNLHGILVQQNANNAELIKALREHIHSEELRHQIIISKLDRINEKLPLRAA